MLSLPNIRNLAVVATVATVGLAPRASGNLSLHADFDGASLDVTASQVSGNSVTLVPRASWTVFNRVDYFRTVTFRVAGALGTTPQFRLHSPPLWFFGSLTGHPFVYSYDQQQWFFFDNNSDDAPGNAPAIPTDFSFSNNTPFTQDIVYVSWGIPYPVSRARSMIDAHAVASLHFQPAASANSFYVIGTGTGGVDELGTPVPAQELLGATITDQRISSLQKQKVVLVSGVHSGETYGNLTLEGFLDFALSGDARAVALRERAILYVYPLVNPDGRFGGFYRSGPENPSLDYNRHWDDPTGFTDLTAARNSMISDTGGDVDMLLDFHCHFTTGIANFLYTNDVSNTGLVQQLLFLRPTTGLIDIELDTGAPPEGFLDSWAGHPLGLSAEFVGTPEACPGLPEQEYLDLGRDFAIAYALSLGDDDTDDDHLPDYWELTHAASLAIMSSLTDTDGDGRNDREEWLEATQPGNPGSLFSPLCSTDGANVTLNWEGHAGRNYRVEESSTLLPGSWAPALAMVPGVDGPMSTLLPLSPSGVRYFRIITSLKE